MTEEQINSRPEEISEKPKRNNSCCIVGVVLAFVVGFIFVSIFAYKQFFYFSSDSAPIPLAEDTSTETSPQAIPPADLLNYFIETTTYYGKESKRYPLSRWTINPITISIHNNVNDETFKAFEDAIAEFNAVSNTKLQTVSSAGNIRVHYMPIDQFPAYNSGEGIKGYMSPTTSNCRFSAADVYVDDTRFPDTAQLTYHDALLLVTRHELLHALGFTGHDISAEVCTALSSVACLIDEYTQYDISAIKMLYNSEIPLCSNETGIRDFFKDNIPI